MNVQLGMPSLHSTLDSLSRQNIDGGVALGVGFMGHSHRFEVSMEDA